MVRAGLGMVAALALGMTPSSAAAAEPGGGFVPAGVVPSTVPVPGPATIAFDVPASDTGTSVAFVLRTRSTITELPALSHPRGWRGADDGTGGPRPGDVFDGSGVTPVPTLNVTGARLDGAGSLTGLIHNQWAALRVGCVRDGVLGWGADFGYRLDLPPGQATRLIVDLDVPRGLAGRAAVVELAPTFAEAYAPAANLTTPAPASSIRQVPVPRASGADAVSLERLPGRGGTHRLSGTVTPARAGQRVEIVGRSARTTSRTTAYFTLDNVIHDKITGQRRLAVATTDAQGRWSARLKLNRRTVLVARTTHGLRGASTRGASCPLTLR